MEANRTYRILMVIAVSLTLAWVAWSIWDGMLQRGGGPGDMAYHAANQAFEQQNYERAIREYNRALEQNPEHVAAMRGLANATMMAGDYERAEGYFDAAIDMDPEFAGTYANRGILRDRMGEHRQALTDYEFAMALDPSVTEGPGWLTRFFRLQPDPPPTIADRAAYLRYQFTLPEDQRRLSDPERDGEQRPYRL
ncbi:tetratricopeptide (TPR) repeat protein [Natronocella acetinitrilica]|uniref:Tetratricopeptide (TPR) repeat protein n=1 Tax=Natronocella acetinitrilica TaxID=414046 RepID=A0AAE3G2T9_9GAMM|nr:tetratricopeptide repeat protein [Natronocella acetinitrilica]MCP1674761.1 tetratricopeptide (TPR) repeat protein [Natronocella acetinitrilica]